MTQPTESQIQKAILDWLAYRKILAWRNQAGMVIVKGKKGKNYAIKLGTKGVSDIVGCLPDGRILCVEVKAKKGKTTPEQEEFIDKINKLGGNAFVARSIKDVENQIKLCLIKN